MVKFHIDSAFLSKLWHLCQDL